MWTNAPLSWYKLVASEKHAIIFVFTFCMLLRVIPELVAYPHPIGYDVVNYYIPVVENFHEHWPSVIDQFPLYVLLLHSVQLVTGLSAQSVVVAAAITIFGSFGISLFYLGRSVLKLGIASSVFLTAFIVFQMVVLRTAWDLHRDIFALAAMMFVLSMLTKNNNSLKGIAIILVLSATTVAADRMIGALFCLSVVTYAFLARRKDTIITSVFATGLFSILMIASYYPNTDAGISNIGVSSEKTQSFYDPQNLVVLFVVANGLLIAPAVIGFLQVKAYMLRVPLLISIAGSFSWLAFPHMGQLVADRWVILAGIFLAIIAAYGILHTAKNLKSKHSVAFVGSILLTFVVIGIAYAVMPYDSPFFLYGLARYSIENFGPVTMQFNSLDIQDNDELVSSIEWINQNTEQDAIIVGEKHWRGFMEIYLEENRMYRYSNDPVALAQALEKQGKQTYHIIFDSGLSPMFRVEDIAIR